MKFYHSSLISSNLYLFTLIKLNIFMAKRLLTSLLTLLLIVGVSSNAEAQRKKKNKKETVKPPPPKPKKGAILPYNKVITKDAKTDEGLFKVHIVDDKYLYEIPDSLFEAIKKIQKQLKKLK